jgi:hypothetical protein
VRPGANSAKESFFQDNDLVCLLLGDVDAIKGFVYETNKLPEIRGASTMLVKVEDELKTLFKERLSPECLIYCSGGSLLAVVPAGEAEEWKNKIERLYLDCTKTASITVAVSRPIQYIELERGLPPYDESSVQSLEGAGIAGDLLFSHFEALSENRSFRKGFGELVADLSARLQRLKREKEKAPFYPALPIHLRCQSCGKRPAFRVDAQVAPPERLCPVCDGKREKGRQQRSSFGARFAEWFAERHGERLSASAPQDLDRLTRAKAKWPSSTPTATTWAISSNWRKPRQITVPSRKLWKRR